MKKSALDLMAYVDPRLIELAEAPAKKTGRRLPWGIAAACLCLAAVLALTIPLLVTRDPVTVPEPDTETEEVTETEPVTETEAVTETEPNETESEEVTETNPTETDDNHGSGGYHPGCAHCTEWNGDFHIFSVVLTNYVTDRDGISNEEISAWLWGDVTDLDGDVLVDCGKNNIYTFLKHYNVTREEFEQLYNYTSLYYRYDYDIDLIYGGDYQALESYYMSSGSIGGERYVESMKKIAEGNLKSDLLYYIAKDTMSEWLDQYGLGYDEMYPTIYTSICRFCIPEVIYLGEISRDTVESFLANSYYHYDYDLDRIYNERESVEAEIAAAKALPTQLEQFAAIRAIDVSLRKGTVKEKK